MEKQEIINQLHATKEFFDRSTRCLEEKHSGFAPSEGMYTAAAQVAHVALTMDWFKEGVFGSGFDMNFSEHDRQAKAFTSLGKARKKLDASLQSLIEAVESRPDNELQEALPKDSIMGGAPKVAALAGVIEHTSHHRGALTVYSRLLGLTPAMPYMETEVNPA